MKKASLGLIGLGQMGKIHFHNCLHLKNARLIAISDVSEKSLVVAKKAGVKHVFKDYNDLLKEPYVDSVIISLPTFLHNKCAQRAAEEGKNIFLEKPMARNIREGEQILSVVKREGVKLMMGYPYRFHGAFTRLKGQLHRGMIGDVQVVVATNISTGPFQQRGDRTIPAPVPSWWFNKELTGGGALLDLGSHMINLLKWYFGDVAGVKSFLGFRFNMDFEDYALCIIKFKDGPMATINVGWFSRDTQVKVEFYGTAEHASAAKTSSAGLLDFGLNLFRRRVLGEKTHFYSELQYFADCVNSDTLPSPSGEEGLEDLRLISTAYRHMSRLDAHEEIAK